MPRRRASKGAVEQGTRGNGQCNEEEAVDDCGSLPKRQKDKQRMGILGEHRNMKRGDRESKVYMTIDDMHEQLRRYRAREFR